MTDTDMGAAPGAAPMPGAEGPGASPAPGGMGPSGSPNSQPMQPKGNQEKAKAVVMQGRKLLAQSLADLEPGTEEFEAVHKCVGILAKAFPAPPQQDLAPAQLVSMMTQKQ